MVRMFGISPKSTPRSTPRTAPQLVADEEALTTCLAGWLANPTARKAVADAAAATVDKLGGALDRTLTALEPYLMQLRLEQRAS